MKMSPEYVRAQENMRPGVITSDGFLGDDTRPIVEIIADDEAHIESLHLDFETVGEQMRRLMDEGRKGLGEPVTIEKWIVQIFEARGHLPSPFQDGIFRKVNAKVTLAESGSPTGHSLLYSDLSLHLLEKYHFLQGRGSAFRLEPRTIKRVLFPE
jgi:hypothetical protein